MKFLTILFLFFVLIFIGCSKQRAIEEDKFVKIYSDLLIAGDTASTKAAKKIVFAKYKIKSQDYENTLRYYNENPELWDAFFEKVIVHIEQRKQKTSSSL